MELLLFPLKVLLIAIDLLITIVTFGWVGAVVKLFTPEPKRSVPVADDKAHRVDPRFKEALASSPREGVETMYDLAKDAFERYADRPCMGQREFLRWKTPKVKEFGPDIKWLTYKEVGDEANKFGAALKKAGLVAAPSTTTLDKIKTPCSLAIFENTCPEWLISALGAFSQSVIVTTIYATLGMDAVVTAINDGAVKAIVCNKKSVKNLADQIKKLPSLKLIIYTNDLVGPDEDVPLPSVKGVTIVSFDDFCASGDTEAYPPTPPKASTCGVLMYTSGSTGVPKGVVIKHKSMVAACASAEIALGLKNGEDVYLGYLPLAHILELGAECAMISQGCTICYADPKSLTATGAYPIGALEQYSPTVMAAVPKIWDTIKKGIQAKVAAGSPVKLFLVNTAFQWRTFCLNHGFDSPLFKALVFKKFSAVVGGRLRYAVSGGGPLNGEVQEFIRVAFGIPLVQGYGLTETNAGGTIQAIDDIRPGIAGVPIPSCQIKLESTPDICDKAGLPYLSTDSRDVDGNIVNGRGHILIKGHNVSEGYYMMPDKTKEVFRDDGFFESGDIGQFMSDGSVRIVDRVKNLVKLKGGEYIALEKMEMTYGNSTFVDAINGGICCYGDGDMDRPVALFQLSEPVTMKWAKANGVQGDFATVKASKELMAAILEDFKTEHKKEGLSHLEKLVAVAPLSDPWTVENGCLTAANKLQRRKVLEINEKEFEEVKKKGIF